jgi:predicted nucleotidyltransferase
MRAREGDLIETDNNVIFDVKGLVHPPHKVIAFPRYIPSAEGTRERGGNLYGKVYNLAERFQYLQQCRLIVFDRCLEKRSGSQSLR